MTLQCERAAPEDVVPQRSSDAEANLFMQGLLGFRLSPFAQDYAPAFS